MNGRMDEMMDEWENEYITILINYQNDERMNGWIDELMLNGRISKGIYDEWINELVL